jgi:hypothetical protein
MQHLAELQLLLNSDITRIRLLEIVDSLSLPDCWIGAGFVRTAVWNTLHARAVSPPDGDVDVIWFDRDRLDQSIDVAIEERLRAMDDSVNWSVKNQARMHVRNCDQPYASSLDAMRFWPDTATAVAVRCVAAGQLEFAAPFGLDDLYAGIVRPTVHFRGAKRSQFTERVRNKRWIERWPSLRLECE